MYVSPQPEAALLVFKQELSSPQQIAFLGLLKQNQGKVLKSSVRSSFLMTSFTAGISAEIRPQSTRILSPCPSKRSLQEDWDACELNVLLSLTNCATFGDGLRDYKYEES